jgi:hypothetical protein
MFLTRVSAGALHLIMGEPADALMLLGLVFMAMAITIIQEQRTERAPDALRDLSNPALWFFVTALHGIPVRRAGRLRRPPGDVLRWLEAGEFEGAANIQVTVVLAPRGDGARRDARIVGVDCYTGAESPPGGAVPPQDRAGVSGLRGQKFPPTTRPPWYSASPNVLGQSMSIFSL